MAGLDIAALRAATPGCAGVHFNHAGASLPAQATIATIVAHLQREARHGPMEAAAEAQPQLGQARADAARLLGASASEIAFTSSTSAGWGLAFAALPPLGPGDRILVGRHEWGGNLATLQAAADHAGARVQAIPCQDDGSVDARALAAMIDDRTRLIALTWLPANGGLINDAAAVGRVARAAGIPYFIDAAQAVGQVPVDVTALGCDVLAATGRKHLRGPRGTALLYVRDGFRPRLRPAFLDVLSGPWLGDGPRPRADARLFETSEAPVALLLGLGYALRAALDLGVPAIRARIRLMADAVRARLGEVPSVTLHDLGSDRSALVSFTVAGIAAADVRARLAARGVTVGANGPAYTPLDMAARGLAGIVRASVSYLTTEDEIEQLVAAVRGL